MLYLKESFNIKRAGHLIRIACFNEWKPLALAGLIVGGFYIVVGLLFGYTGKTQAFGFYINVSLGLGIVLVSRVFTDLHNVETGSYYLTLPGSQEEKFLIRLVATTLGYFAYIMVMLGAATIISSVINYLLFSTQFRVFNPFNYRLMGTFGKYLFMHALFFTGAIYFKRYSFFKTGLCILGVTFIIGTVLGFIFKFFIIGELSGLSATLRSFDNLPSGFPGQFRNFFTQQARIVYWYILPVLLYLTSYFRYRELEIKG